MKRLLNRIQLQKEKQSYNGLFRVLSPVPLASSAYLKFNSIPVVNLTSNNYLSLSSDPEILEALRGQKTVGAGASRLLSGTDPIHEELENEISKWKSCESALVFPTGYQANLGLLTSIMEKGDTAYCDRTCHASLIDGVRLSGASLKVFRHNNPEDLEKKLQRNNEKGCRFVIVESLYSMDGDFCPLREIWKICQKNSVWMIVDEAHAGGIYGKNGAGRLEFSDLSGKEGILQTGTLSKAVGAQGGFVAGPAWLKEHLVNHAKTFIYTTGLAPPLVAAALCSIKKIQKMRKERKCLLSKASWLQKKLINLGFTKTNDNASPILPIILGSADKVIQIAKALKTDKEKAFWVSAIRPPTVPKGTSRLRCSLQLAHQQNDLEDFISKLKSILL